MRTLKNARNFKKSLTIPLTTAAFFAALGIGTVMTNNNASASETQGNQAQTAEHDTTANHILATKSLNTGLSQSQSGSSQASGSAQPVVKSVATQSGNSTNSGFGASPTSGFGDENGNDGDNENVGDDGANNDNNDQGGYTDDNGGDSNNNPSNNIVGDGRTVVNNNDHEYYGDHDNGADDAALIAAINKNNQDDEANDMAEIKDNDANAALSRQQSDEQHQAAQDQEEQSEQAAISGAAQSDAESESAQSAQNSLKNSDEMASLQTSISASNSVTSRENSIANSIASSQNSFEGFQTSNQAAVQSAAQEALNSVNDDNNLNDAQRAKIINEIQAAETGLSNKISTATNADALSGLNDQANRMFNNATNEATRDQTTDTNNAHQDAQNTVNSSVNSADASIIGNSNLSDQQKAALVSQVNSEANVARTNISQANSDNDVQSLVNTLGSNTNDLMSEATSEGTSDSAARVSMGDSAINSEQVSVVNSINQNSNLDPTQRAALISEIDSQANSATAVQPSLLGSDSASRNIIDYPTYQRAKIASQEASMNSELKSMASSAANMPSPAQNSDVADNNLSRPNSAWMSSEKKMVVGSLQADVQSVKESEAESSVASSEEATGSYVAANPNSVIPGGDFWSEHHSPEQIQEYEQDQSESESAESQAQSLAALPASDQSAAIDSVANSIDSSDASAMNSILDEESFNDANFVSNGKRNLGAEAPTAADPVVPSTKDNGSNTNKDNTLGKWHWNTDGRKILPPAHGFYEDTGHWTYNLGSNSASSNSDSLTAGNPFDTGQGGNGGALQSLTSQVDSTANANRTAAQSVANMSIDSTANSLVDSINNDSNLTTGTRSSMASAIYSTEADDKSGIANAQFIPNIQSYNAGLNSFANNEASAADYDTQQANHWFQNDPYNPEQEAPNGYHYNANGDLLANANTPKGPGADKVINDEKQGIDDNGMGNDTYSMKYQKAYQQFAKTYGDTPYTAALASASLNGTLPYALDPWMASDLVYGALDDEGYDSSYQNALSHFESLYGNTPYAYAMTSAMLDGSVPYNAPVANALLNGDLPGDYDLANALLNGNLPYSSAVAQDLLAGNMPYKSALVSDIMNGNLPFRDALAKNLLSGYLPYKSALAMDLLNGNVPYRAALQNASLQNAEFKGSVVQKDEALQNIATGKAAVQQSMYSGVPFDYAPFVNSSAARSLGTTKWSTRYLAGYKPVVKGYYTPFGIRYNLKYKKVYRTAHGEIKNGNPFMAYLTGNREYLPKYHYSYVAGYKPVVKGFYTVYGWEYHVSYKPIIRRISTVGNWLAGPNAMEFANGMIANSYVNGVIPEINGVYPGTEIPTSLIPFQPVSYYYGVPYMVINGVAYTESNNWLVPLSSVVPVRYASSNVSDNSVNKNELTAIPTSTNSVINKNASNVTSGAVNNQQGRLPQTDEETDNGFSVALGLALLGLGLAGADLARRHANRA